MIPTDFHIFQRGGSTTNQKTIFLFSFYGSWSWWLVMVPIRLMLRLLVTGFTDAQMNDLRKAFQRNKSDDTERTLGAIFGQVAKDSKETDGEATKVLV